MTESLIKAFSVVLLSSIKHTLGGVPLAVGYGYSYFEVAGFSLLGGIIGVAFYIILAQTFVSVKKRAFRHRKKRIFSRKNRLIVKVKRRFGLGGIAFITPCLLSLPLGTIIASGMYRNKKKVFLYMSVSVLFWSFAGAALVHPLINLIG